MNSTGTGTGLIVTSPVRWPDPFAELTCIGSKQFVHNFKYRVGLRQRFTIAISKHSGLKALAFSVREFRAGMQVLGRMHGRAMQAGSFYNQKVYHNVQLCETLIAHGRTKW